MGVVSTPYTRVYGVSTRVRRRSKRVDIEKSGKKWVRRINQSTFILVREVPPVENIEKIGKECNHSTFTLIREVPPVDNMNGQIIGKKRER